MRTDHTCIVCSKPIMTNQTIVGFPVIRITNINQSAMTGSELLAHADCFTNRINVKPLEILNLNGTH